MNPISAPPIQVITPVVVTVPIFLAFRVRNSQGISGSGLSNGTCILAA